ncbi:SDR family NAD(P)-dependent oxidoreductase [Pseudomonas agarici]|uniref:SDR family NAD(P)-dependent oxidoreductase n=1 Tax=Pseudomonas agarici TaxID=46677 RepID=UPI00030F86D6|nr:SDR family oxidoreductase [Pseudomonas agarici]NWB90591.1 SDR family oxidoreductase [Pseudomonas agarici]NWC09725.1 SDR family oxidoreductase [Pseudomonas agarici]SEL65719.1 NAD(P)-dependent dehydrogenase, short-chain alcohol dehydrogenase family [Pseudomonas agarici]
MSEIKKVAIITGASQSMGEGIVNGFRARGYGVVATSRSIQPSTDPDLVTVRGDIGDPQTGARLVAAALDRFGRIDTLVNNAGIFIGKPFTEYTEEDYRLKLKTNLDGFFFTTQHVIPVMLEQGSGHVVQITASAAEFAVSSSPAFIAMLTKGGMNSATKSLAIEYAKRGIRVNAVAPGIIRTPMHDPQIVEQLAAFHPMNKLGEVEDIVRAVLYLEDATFSTGEILHVDGGLIAGR